MSNIPEGWQSASIGDLLIKIVGGGTPDKRELNYFEGSIPFMTVKDMRSLYPKDTKDKISVEALENSSAKLIPSDSIIISTRMGLGKVCRVQFDTAINQDLKALFPGTGINKDFLARWFQNNSEMIQKLGKGTTVKGITLETLRSLKIDTPPQNEQKKIADKIDGLLSRSNKATEALDSIPVLLDQYRQSILVAAFRGDLTENWRKGGSFSYKNVTVSEVANEIRYGTSKKCTYSPTKTAVLRIPNIGDDEILLDNLKHADFDQKEIDKLSLEEGDVLVIRSNGSINLVGKSVCVSSKEAGYLFAGYLIRIRPNQTRIYPKYLHYFISSPKARRHMTLGAKSTSGVNNVNSKQIGSLNIPLPSIEEQAEIIRLIEHSIVKFKRLLLLNKSLEKDIAELNRSVLAKAFRGELTPQDPNDETAKQLLKRIKLERNQFDEGLRERKRNVRKKSSGKRIDMIISVVDALHKSKDPLSAQQLLSAAGYPNNASVDQIEQFFLDIRQSVNNAQIEMWRDDNQDYFKVIE